MRTFRHEFTKLCGGEKVLITYDETEQCQVIKVEMENDLMVLANESGSKLTQAQRLEVLDAVLFNLLTSERS